MPSSSLFDKYRPNFQHPNTLHPGRLTWLSPVCCEPWVSGSGTRTHLQTDGTGAGLCQTYSTPLASIRPVSQSKPSLVSRKDPQEKISRHNLPTILGSFTHHLFFFLSIEQLYPFLYIVMYTLTLKEDSSVSFPSWFFCPYGVIKQLQGPKHYSFIAFN